MKQKTFYFIAIFIILMMLFTIPIYATNTGTISADTLKLRKEASATSEIVKLLNKGEKVDIVSEEGDWYKVKYGDNTGYVSKQYVTTSNSTDTKTNNNVENNVTTTSTTLENNVTENNTTGDTTELNDNIIKRDAKIKILPVISSNDIGEIKEGTKVEIISTTNNWAFIESEDITGWVSLNNFEESGASQGIIQEENTTDTESIVEDENTVSETNNTVSESTTEGTTTVQSSTKYINTTSAYIRSKASTSSEILATLIKNTDVKVNGEEGDWYKVTYNNVTGYIRKDLLSDSKSTETTSRSGDTVTREANNSLGTQVVDYAKQYLSCPYVYGQSGPSSFDCSGFTMYVYNHFGYSLPHSATAQATYGKEVSKDNLQAGDLVFFLDYETMDGIGHCGIYIGDGNFIHASSGTGYCVKISTLLSGSYLNRFNTARRII